MTENQNQEAQAEERQEATVPSSRLRQETEKRQEAERRAREAAQELQRFRDEQEEAEAEKERQKGQHEKTAERERRKREEAEKARDKAIADLVTYKTRGAFSRSARGIIRADAIDDAYLFLTPDELDSLKDAPDDRFEAAARRLAESRPYLADGHRGAGSGGSSSRATEDARTGRVRTQSPLRAKSKRKIW